MAGTEDAASESVIAEAIRDAFTTQMTGMSVADALYEVSRSLDRLAAAIENQRQSGSRRW